MNRSSLVKKFWNTRYRTVRKFKFSYRKWICSSKDERSQSINIGRPRKGWNEARITSKTWRRRRRKGETQLPRVRAARRIGVGHSIALRVEATSWAGQTWRNIRTTSSRGGNARRESTKRADTTRRSHLFAFSVTLATSTASCRLLTVWPPSPAGPPPPSALRTLPHHIPREWITLVREPGAHDNAKTRDYRPPPWLGLPCCFLHSSPRTEHTSRKACFSRKKVCFPSRKHPFTILTTCTREISCYACLLTG